METYATLLKNVAQTVDRFMVDNISNGMARDFLADQFDGVISRDTSSGHPRLRVNKDAVPEGEMPSFFKDLGISSPDDLSEDTVEQDVVPAARKYLAHQRQQSAGRATCGRRSHGGGHTSGSSSAGGGSTAHVHRGSNAGGAGYTVQSGDAGLGGGSVGAEVLRMYQVQMAETLIALVEAIEPPPGTGLVVTEAVMEVPMEVSGVLINDSMVFFAAPPDTRWES